MTVYGQLHLRAVPEPLHWTVVVYLEKEGGTGELSNFWVRDLIVDRKEAPTPDAALELAERCIRGELAEGIWCPWLP